MVDGDAVFAADGSHIGRLARLDDAWLTVRGEGHTFRIPRTGVAYEHDNRLFLTAPNRASAYLWRIDVGGASGIQGWWRRRVLGPSPRLLGGRLED